MRALTPNMFSETLTLNNNTKHISRGFGEDGISSLRASPPKGGERLARQAGNRLRQQGGCNDSNHACIGGDSGCCRLVSWQSSCCPDKAIDVVLGGVGPGQRFGGAFEGLHHQNRHSNEV